MSAHLPAPPTTARRASRASRAGNAPAWSSERTLLQAEGRESRIAFVVSGVLGALYALWLYGVRVVDPTSVHWLLHGDAAQHFIGLSYFLVEPWHWPLGAIRRFGSDPTSVVFTDSIPLLALPAKALGMPSGTQYFGIWMLACHALVAAFGALLLRRLGAPAVAAVLGAAFFACAPVVLLRAYGHEALMGHFLVVAALAAAFGRWSALGWIALLVASVLVHPYLGAMVFAIAVAATAAALQRGALRAGVLLSWAPALLGVPALLAWQAGYFVGRGDLSSWGHGYYSANALTWIDPMDWKEFMSTHGRDARQVAEWSALLPPWPQASAGQYEGFAYLGAGVIAIVVVAVVTLAGWPFRERRNVAVVPEAASRATWLWLLAACTGLALLALSIRPSIGNRILFDVRVSETVHQLLGVFRASGRFIWPLTWLLMGWAIARVARLRGGIALLAGALLLQAVDLTPRNIDFYNVFRKGTSDLQPVPSAPAWAQVLHACPRLEWLGDPARGERWITPAVAAVRAGVQMVDAPTARRSTTTAALQERNLAALRRGEGWRDDTVYVDLQQAEEGQGVRAGLFPGVPAAFVPLSMDGFTVFVAARCISGAGAESR